MVDRYRWTNEWMDESSSSSPPLPDLFRNKRKSTGMIDDKRPQVHVLHCTALYNTMYNTNKQTTTILFTIGISVTTNRPATASSLKGLTCLPPTWIGFDYFRHVTSHRVTSLPKMVFLDCTVRYGAVLVLCTPRCVAGRSSTRTGYHCKLKRNYARQWQEGKEWSLLVGASFGLSFAVPYVLVRVLLYCIPK